jgi:polyisoprenoid-binding protein YceI
MRKPFTSASAGSQASRRTRSWGRATGFSAPGFLLLCVLGAPAVAEPFTYTFDPAHSFVNFELMHFGTSTIRGRFGPVNGSVALDRAAGSGSMNVVIDTASVSTGLRVFDARIREPDLLAGSAYPQALFAAERFRFEGDRLAEVSGRFTLRGVSQPLSLRALRFACEWRELLQREVCGGDFEAEIQRSAFGAVFGLPFVADRVRILVQVEGSRQ